jgi:hypothetical protein
MYTNGMKVAVTDWINTAYQSDHRLVIVPLVDVVPAHWRLAQMNKE